MTRIIRALAPAVAASGLMLLGLVGPSTASAGTFTSGAWTLTAPQTDSFSAQVEQPINPNGTSVWSAKRGVIPVQFTLTDTRSFAFESLLGATTVDDGLYSAAIYVPTSPITASDLTSLSANFSWITGQSHGGALRWSISLANGKNIFVYYGALPGLTGVGGSGDNLLAATDLRFDTSQLGGTFYDTWANAQALAGSTQVTSVSLVIDAGWGGSQVLGLTSATVTDSVNGASTFTMPAATSSPTTAPAMYIDIVKGTSSDPGTVDETTFTGVGDSSGQFAVVNGMYKYNLSTTSLSGAGTYWVYMTPNTDANRIASGGTFVLK